MDRQLPSNRIKIGVFDSGIGGVAVVKAIQKGLPDLEIIYKDDAEHLPYGTRGIEEIYSFVTPIFQSFIDEGCKVIVIACNTVTTNLISRLRAEFPVPMVGMEPMIKPAATATKTGIIAVCATPRTLQSERYRWLKQKYAKRITVLEPDCSDWALMIENNTVDREKIAKIVNDVCEAGTDQIVLGCTHYHWIEKIIKDLASGRANVIQPEKPVVAQLKRVLEQPYKKLNSVNNPLDTWLNRDTVELKVQETAHPTVEPLVNFPLSQEGLYRLTLFKWEYTLEAYGFTPQEAEKLLFLKWLYFRHYFTPKIES